MTNYHEEMQKAAEEHANKFQMKFIGDLSETPNPVWGVEYAAYIAGAAKSLELLGKGEGEHGPRILAWIWKDGYLREARRIDHAFDAEKLDATWGVSKEYCPVSELVATRARYERELAELRDKLAATEEARVKLDLWAAELHGERDDAREREAKLRVLIKGECRCDGKLDYSHSKYTPITCRFCEALEHP